MMSTSFEDSIVMLFPQLKIIKLYYHKNITEVYRSFYTIIHKMKIAATLQPKHGIKSPISMEQKRHN